MAKMTLEELRKLREEKQEALEKMKKYANCSIDMIEHGIKLHGDGFFTKVDEWFNELDLGADPVRNVKLIVSDILRMFENPSLSVLFDMEEYQQLKKTLHRRLQKEK